MSNRQSIRRTIIKQGYLKKLPNAAKIGSSFKKPARRWFVFGVMSGTEPYLEYYENEDAIFTDSPINMFMLDTCLYINKNQPANRYGHLFTIVLKDRHLKLVAQTRTLMYDWCRTLEAKLRHLGILRETRENDYSALPGSGRENAPLPPLPPEDNAEEEDGAPPQLPERPVLASPSPEPADTSQPMQTESPAPPSYEPDSSPAPVYEQNRDSSLYAPVWDQNSPAAPVYSTPYRNRPRDLPRVTSMTEAPPPDLPPPLLHSPLSRTLSSPLMTPTSPVPFPSPLSSPCFPEVFVGPDIPQLVSPTSSSFILPDKLQEAQTSPTTDAVHGWNMPPPASDAAPPPYMSRNVLDRGANKSLKHTQVEQLQKEISTDAGVKIILRKIDCFHAIALVEFNQRIWIAGWNQEARPFLNNAFHFGDQLVSVNGQVLEGAKMAYKLIKNCNTNDKITFMISRTPNAQVFALHRSVEGESLGMRRNGGTAEIIYVDPGGLVGQSGLPAKATTMKNDDLCNWWITEVNCRPLNIFFTDNEIETRLNAVGKDISIMVQPKDFIFELRKQLKSCHRNYKDFLLY